MTDSYQDEIPKARINITLNVETGGAQKKKELPLKLLVLNDFSNGKTKGPIAKRERININSNNFKRIIEDLGPELQYVVPNRIKNDGTDIKVNLKVRHINDFHPEQIVRQTPELNNLLAMRNLLKDLKANLIDNKRFRNELERIVREKKALDALNNELQMIAPLTQSKESDDADTKEDQ